MPSDPISADLAFMHLSDIHFRHGRAGDAHDEDRLLRHELQLDLRRLRTRLTRLDGLIVSGDVAFSGKSDEFDYARGWLESVREQLECPPESVMITPGNHDVDHASIPPAGEIEALHQEIRQGATLAEHDARLANILRDNDRGNALLRPLDAYNAFANTYRCTIDRTHPYWERDFNLGDGTTLRIRGIATTLLSGPGDDLQTRKMLYGGAQRVILRETNVRYAIVGHHPPSWTIEGDAADQVFSTFTSLQIFGHKHEQWLTRVGDSVRLIAGAVHPSRLESNWLPRYAALTVTAIDGNALQLRIYPRRWSTEESKFMADFNSEGHDYRDYTVPVEQRQI